MIFFNDFEDIFDYQDENVVAVQVLALALIVEIELVTSGYF